MSPEKLSLVSNTVSVAIYCDHKAVSGSHAFLVVDIGEFAVHIASYCTIGGCIKQLGLPASNSWGGRTVNEEFSHFLQEFVDDEGFKCYVGNHSSKKQVRHKADLNRLLTPNLSPKKNDLVHVQHRRKAALNFHPHL